MSAHTPGPRIVENGKDDGVSFCIVLGAGHEFVATFENYADALLDAAAPKLLAALEDLQAAAADFMLSSSNDGSWLIRSCEEARAAIAAAKGET